MVKPIEGLVNALLGGGSQSSQSNPTAAPQAPATTAPPPSAPPVQSPQGTPAGGKPGGGGPSFLAAAATSPTQQSMGAKTLLGQ